MMSFWMKICEVIPEVHISWLPLGIKMFLFHYITHPIEVNVRGIVTFLFDGSFHDSICRRFFCDYISGPLWMAHLFQVRPKWFQLFGIVEWCSTFCLCRQKHYVTYDIWYDHNRAIWLADTVACISHVERTSWFDPGLQFRKIKCITVRSEYYTAGLLLKGSIRMYGAIIKEFVDRLFRFDCSTRLCC